MSKQTSITHTDNYDSFAKRIYKSIEKEYTFLAIFVTCVTIFLDYAVSQPKFDSLLSEGSRFVLFVLCATTVLLLDVPGFVIGSTIKELLTRTRPKIEAICIIVSLLVVVFMMAFLNLKLSLITAQHVFENNNNSPDNLFEETTEQEQQADNESALVGAYILGLAPFLTTLCSIAVSCFATNPLIKEKNKAAKVLLQDLSEIKSLRMAEAEIIYKDPAIYLLAQMIRALRIVDRDNMSPEAYIEQVWDLCNKVIADFPKTELYQRVFAVYESKGEIITADESAKLQAYLQALIIQLNNPNDISEISEYATEKSAEYNDLISIKEPVTYNN